MGGGIATHTEIVDAAYQAFAEQIGPNLIYDDTRHNRILAVHQPPGEIETVSFASVTDLWQGGNGVCKDLFTGLFKFTAM